MTRDTAKDLSMFILRVIVGCIFVAHGAQKLFGMFGGIGLEGTAKMMEGLGFRYPHVFANIWSGIEFVGGIFLVLGVFTRYSAVLISLVMAVTIWKISSAYGFFLQDGGFEYNLLIIGACMPLVFMGGGSWSIWDV